MSKFSIQYNSLNVTSFPELNELTLLQFTIYIRDWVLETISTHSEIETKIGIGQLALLPSLYQVHIIPLISVINPKYS